MQVEVLDPYKLYLIDVSSFIFRAYYSVGHLSTSKGVPTGAVFGVANMLIKLASEGGFSHIAAAMDSRTPTFRKEIYPNYKANRPPPPEDLKVQFPFVEELLSGFGIAVLQKDGYEADDLIATACARAREAHMDVIIVSGDKDLMQLVGPHVTMLDTMKNITYDETAVETKWGVPPLKLLELFAIVGDSSDNIPGVPRVGLKTAAPLIKEFNSLDGIYSNISSITSKAVKARLEEHKESAYLSKRLVDLEKNVPIDINFELMRGKTPDAEKLRAVFDKFELASLEERLLGKKKEAPKETEYNYTTVTDIASLEQIAKTIRRAGIFAVDLETTSIDAVCAEIVGVALAWPGEPAVYVPVAHRDGLRLPLDDVLKIIGPLLSDPEIGVVAQNVKYEDTIFRRHGIYIQNVAFDPMLASYLVRADRRAHGLDVLAKELLGHTMISYDEVTEKGRGTQLSFDAVSVNRATEYSGEDAFMTLKLVEKMAPLVQSAGMSKLLYEVEIPLARVLCGMELAGVLVDCDLLGRMSVQFGEELLVLETRAFALAGREFNLSSPKQLQEILFDELRLPTQKKTKTGYSTDSEVLEALAPMHELPAILVEHRLLSKLKNTYLDALPRLCNPATGRIHTSFNQAVTVTGRLSSSNPNLQNIPIRTKRGRDIRHGFIAAPGCVLVSADYSQVELRILAHLSKDEALINAFKNGDDIHDRTAKAIFGYESDEQIQPEDRSSAKAINFGVIYGKTDFSLAKELQIPRSEAKRFIDEYFRLYKGVERYMDETIKRAEQERSVSTLLGRKRRLDDIGSPNHNIRMQAARMARNTPIQGTAADLLKVAMIKVSERLKQEPLDAKMILTVHDELVFEIIESKADSLIPIVKEEMENALNLDVPLVVDVGVGKNWAQAH